MPIYEYRCDKCRKLHEIMQKITEKPLSICPNCGGKMKKMMSSTSFVLKGSGWYATDYADKTRKEAKEETGKTEKGVTPVTKEAKSEAKSEPKPPSSSKE